MKSIQKKKPIFSLSLLFLVILLLSACGGGKKQSKRQISSNYRLVSIDLDRGANDFIDQKFVYQYDDKGNNYSIKKIDFNDNTRNITTSKTFDENGNILKIEEKSTDSVQSQSKVLRLWLFTYAKSGKITSKKYQDFEQNVFEYWIEEKNTRTYYSREGEIISISRFIADKNGNKVNELIDTNNNGKADRQVISSYNNRGKLLTRITTDLNDTSRAILSKETRSYDTYGNVESITISYPSRNTESQVTKFEYTYDIYENISTSSTIYDSGRIDKRIYVWEEIMPPVSFIGPVSWAGTGCKANSLSISGEQTDSLSILFDSYDAGKDSRSHLKRASCSFSITIKVLPGYRISQLTSDWEGYAEGQGELKRKYFLAGNPYTTWLQNSYNNPDGDNFSHRDDIYNDSFITACRGKEFNVRIDSQIKTMGINSYMAIDSTDLHGNVRFLLRSERCL